MNGSKINMNSNLMHINKNKKDIISKQTSYASPIKMKKMQQKQFHTNSKNNDDEGTTHYLDTLIEMDENSKTVSLDKSTDLHTEESVVSDNQFINYMNSIWDKNKLFMIPFFTKNKMLLELLFKIMESILYTKNKFLNISKLLEPFLKTNSLHTIVNMIANNIITLNRTIKKGEIKVFKDILINKILYLYKNPLKIPIELSILLIESKLQEDEFTQSETEYKQFYMFYIEFVLNYLIYIISFSKQDYIFNTLEFICDYKNTILSIC